MELDVDREGGGDVRMTLLDELREILVDDTHEKTQVKLNSFQRMCKSIFTSETTSTIFCYLLEYGACSAFTLINELSQNEANVYRSLKRLKELDLIEQAVSLDKHVNSRGGPRPKIWGLVGCHPTQISDARKHHYYLEDEFWSKVRS